jgi:hypothetical protein
MNTGRKDKAETVSIRYFLLKVLKKDKIGLKSTVDKKKYLFRMSN